MEKYPNVLVVRTFSKSASLAGARLGYALGSEALIEDLKKLKYSTNPYSVNRTALCAGAAAIRDWACCAANCRRIAFERRRLTAELVKRGFELTDSSANFVLGAPLPYRRAGVYGGAPGARHPHPLPGRRALGLGAHNDRHAGADGRAARGHGRDTETELRE